MSINYKEWLNNDELAINIFEKKYRNGDESLDQWLERVTAGDEEVKRLILEKKFLPGGRVLANRGVSDKHGCLNNCFVLPSPEDSIEGIYKTAAEIARTFSYGGGVGINISTLRPKGLRVNNAAQTTSGAVSFIDLYDTTANLISQGQRRGALMVCMNSDHPDIEEFVDLKADLNKATKANVSVMADDEFMERAVDNDKNGYLAHFSCSEIDQEMSKPIDAAKLFNKIAQRNWEMAEPGMLFYNNINNNHILSEYDEIDIRCPNPCTTGDTLILTDKGHIEIGELVGQHVNVWNGFEFSNVEIKKTGENVPVNIVKFSNGTELKCTPYHKFILNNGVRVECSSLKAGDKLIKCEFPVISGENKLHAAYTQGFYSGDGCYDKTKNITYIDFWDDKQQCIDRCKDETNVVAYKPSNDGRIIRCNVDVPFSKDFVPINGYDLNSKIRWLEGICDSDGSVSDDGTIMVTSVNGNFIKNMFFMLQTIGVSCTWSLCKAGGSKDFPEHCGGKTYETKDLYRIVIANSDVVKLKQFGFNPVRVNSEYVGNRSAKRHIVVTSIEPFGSEDVFCFTEPKNHSGIFNGVITAQCGEIPMEPGSACLLASFNLAEYVDDSVHRFKLKEFAKDVRTVVVFMEKLQEESIDLLPLQIQKDQAERWKRIGIGIMGLADALIKMRVRYGSPDSLRICDQIGNVMAHEALIASEKYGLEHGSFIGFDETKVNNSDYVKRHVQHVSALRNGSLLTIAPTGTLSTMLGVSGGIEPLFDTIYTRKTESLDGEDKYYHINAPIVQKYMDENGMCGINELPDFFITAKQVPWKERIAMQSVWQQHIDQAISSTVNLPEHISVNEIGLLYEEAWRKGLKGITVYRDNCRRVGILTSEPQKTESKDDKNMECIKQPAIKPVETPNDPIGKKRKINSGCGPTHCIAFFDRDTGQLMEVYLGKGSKGGCHNYMIGLARLISLAARGGIDIYNIVDQLKSSGTCPSYATRSAMYKDTSKGSSCPVAIGNALADMYQEMQEEIDRGMYWDYVSDEDEEEELLSDVQEMIHVKLPEEVQPFDPSIYSVMKYHQMPIQPLETERGPVADPKKKDDRPNAGIVCPECQRVIPVKTGGCWSCPSCGWSKCN